MRKVGRNYWLVLYAATRDGRLRKEIMGDASGLTLRREGISVDIQSVIK